MILEFTILDQKLSKIYLEIKVDIWVIANYPAVTALRWGFYKYLTAQDTQTPSKHNKPFPNLFSLHFGSAIQVNKNVLSVGLG